MVVLAEQTFHSASCRSQLQHPVVMQWECPPDEILAEYHPAHVHYLLSAYCRAYWER